VTWFKVDDSFDDHPKVIALLEDRSGPQALALWLCCGAWSARHLTDGFIPNARIGASQSASKCRRNASQSASKCRRNAALAMLLCSVGLWKRADDGFQFHDWSDYQPTRKVVQSKRERARDRVRKFRERGACNALQDRYAENGNALHARNGNAPVTPPPSRPVPSREKQEPPISPPGGAIDSERIEPNSNSGAHLAEVSAGWAEGFELAGAEAPALVGQPLHAGAAFARRLAKRHGRPLRVVARDVACAVAALDGPRIDVWALGQVDPYAKRKRASSGRTGGFMEPSNHYPEAPTTEAEVEAQLDRLFGPCPKVGTAK